MWLLDINATPVEKLGMRKHNLELYLKSQALLV